MKLARILFVAVAALAFGGFAFATPPGQSVTFDSPEGTVTFDGDFHTSKGAKCADCHPKVFPMKSGETKFTMAEMQKGQSCGTCHDGTKAFSVSDEATCTHCHKK